MTNDTHGKSPAEELDDDEIEKPYSALIRKGLRFVKSD